MVTGLVCLAETYCDLGRYQEAGALAQQALEQSQQIGERRQEAGALEIIATVQRHLGNTTESIREYLNALALAEKINFRYGVASILTGLAAAHRDANQPTDAIAYATRALSTMTETDMRVLEGAALTELAAGHLALGALDQADHHINRALKVAGSQQLIEARALHIQGLVQEAMHGFETALPLWEKALEMFTCIGTPEAEEVQRLTAGPPPPA
jgi:tetratricopeptide (TPR) repeat protein